MNTRSPEAAGFSSSRLTRIDRAMQKKIDQNDLPGAVVMVARRGQIVFTNCYGYQDVDLQHPMRPDTLFRIHSMTKAITCSGVMMLHEEGCFQLCDPIASFLPAFKDPTVLLTGDGQPSRRVPAEREITILDLLTHTAGLSYGSYDNELDALYRQLFRELDLPGSKSSTSPVPLSLFVEKLAELPLAYHPGRSWRYSLSIDVLGHLIEKVSGLALDQFLQQRILDPLGMHDSGFFVPQNKIERLAPQYSANKEHGWLVSDPAAGGRYSRPPRFLEGGGGLVSTAADYMRFAQMLLNGGELKGTRLLGRKSVAFMTRNHLPASTLPISFQNSDVLNGCGYGIGFAVLMDVVRSGRLGTANICTWGGAASTGFWIDPQEDLICIVMAQATPNRHPQLDLMGPVYQALID